MDLASSLIAAAFGQHDNLAMFCLVCIGVWNAAAMYYGVRRIKEAAEQHEVLDATRHQETQARFGTIETDIKTLLRNGA